MNYILVAFRSRESKTIDKACLYTDFAIYKMHKDNSCVAKPKLNVIANMNTYY